MPWTLVIWLISVALCLALITRRHFDSEAAEWWARVRALPWRWWLLGYPVAVLRIVFTWRRLADNAGLSVNRRRQARRGGLVVGDMVVPARSLRLLPPRLGLPRPTRLGLRVRLHLHPGQSPGPFIAAADAMAHAWRVYAVRVTSPRRGEVLVTVLAGNPLAVDAVASGNRPARALLSAQVGRFEDGGPWLVDLRRVPHWLVIGATRSGKSNWLAALVRELAPQPVALVGIDCKGGMELSLMAARLSALATNRTEAAHLLGGLVAEAEHRMAVCRAAGVRSVWELPAKVRPVPVVCVVDELAELYLTDGSPEGRRAAAECSTALLRLAQLGAALGLHLVVAGQRFGSELGPGVTALRAQLGGRICHAVNDGTTAEMALGDLAPDAVAVAQSITEDEQGVAVTTVGARWMLARSTLVTTEDSRAVAEKYADMTPEFPGLGNPGGGKVA